MEMGSGLGRVRGSEEEDREGDRESPEVPQDPTHPLGRFTYRAS